jgi:quercetin 2,3-dioxygenase
LAPGLRLYLHVACGQISANGVTLAAGDALKLTDTSTLLLRDAGAAEVLVFDLPGADS